MSDDQMRAKTKFSSRLVKGRADYLFCNISGVVPLVKVGTVAILFGLTCYICLSKQSMALRNRFGITMGSCLQTRSLLKKHMAADV